MGDGSLSGAGAASHSRRGYQVCCQCRPETPPQTWIQTFVNAAVPRLRCRHLPTRLRIDQTGSRIGDREHPRILSNAWGRLGLVWISSASGGAQPSRTLTKGARALPVPRSARHPPNRLSRTESPSVLGRTASLVILMIGPDTAPNRMCQPHAATRSRSTPIAAALSHDCSSILQGNSLCIHR